MDSTPRIGLATVLMMVVLVMLLVAIAPDDDHPRPAPTFSEFLAQLDRGQIDRVTIRTRDNSLRITPDRDRDYETGYVSDLGHEVMTRLNAAGVDSTLNRRAGSGGSHQPWWSCPSPF